MGFLHKLWDETLAGPIPDTGLSKLRKFDSSHDPPLTPTVTIIRPNSDSDLLISRTPSGNFGKFAVGKSSFQSPVRAVNTTPTEFYWIMISALHR